jgi:uncharacterized protein YdeI (YjbR/CyaY-like superfamily)
MNTLQACRVDPMETKLKRPLQAMPEDVGDALEERWLVADYAARPAYQRNDYLAWIAGAKRPATRAKRIRQMLDELEAGGVYMNMKHPASAKR